MFRLLNGEPLALKLFEDFVLRRGHELLICLPDARNLFTANCPKLTVTGQQKAASTGILSQDFDDLVPNAVACVKLSDDSLHLRNSIFDFSCLSQQLPFCEARDSGCNANQCRPDSV